MVSETLCITPSENFHLNVLPLGILNSMRIPGEGVVSTFSASWNDLSYDNIALKLTESGPSAS